jgi:glycosyltransferase involved in cell wall biosynthesis
MKKVLFVFSHPAPYKVHFFNSLAQHVDLTVVFERTLGSYSQKQYQNSPPFQFKTIKIGGFPIGKENHYSTQLIRHLKKHTYDLIIMNGYSSWTEMLTIRYLIKKKIPYYLYVNGGIIRKESRIKYLLKKYLISHAKSYFSPSPVMDSYLLHYGATKETIFHYPYATIFEHDVRLHPLTLEEKMAIRSRYHLSSQHLTISVGQFIKRKNFLALLTFWTTLPTSFHLLLVGDGPLFHQYQKFIARHALRNVTLLTFQPKATLLEMYQSADAFILLSKEDIYGHVINEALSQGLPVMTTIQTMSGQHLITPHNGRLVDVHQPATWRKAFEELVSLENPQASLSVARNNTFEKMVQQHLTIFRELL